MPHRLRPIVSALADFFHHWPIAALATLAWTAIEKVFELYVQLLATNGVLLAVAVALLMLDTVVGIYASLRRGERFRARRLAAFFDKVVQYTITMIVFILLANGSEEVSLLGLAFSQLDEFGLFIIAFREGSSVMENISGKTLDEVIRSTWRRMGEFATLHRQGEVSDNANNQRSDS